jgi:hypothetical protein
MLERIRGFFAGREPRGSGHRAAASSFHLWWDLPRTGPVLEVAVVLEVEEPPVVERLYFWALQVGFSDDGGTRPGGAHIGLQWNPAHPGHGAVNWGGYASQQRGGAILQGSASGLPSARQDPNTRDYPWLPGRRYRLRVTPTPEERGWWRGTVTDLDTGTETVVRDLRGGGSRLVDPVVWSEVFADCDDPRVAVRWSDFRVVDAVGQTFAPRALRVNYQAPERGGCPNTNSVVVGGTAIQATNSERVIPQGASLRL